MSFKKIDAPSIKELFLSQIEEMILSGELKPGDRLPTERELADTMGISKTGRASTLPIIPAPAIWIPFLLLYAIGAICRIRKC